MEHIHKAYVDLVKRNYLYKQGGIIEMPKFDQAVTSILFTKN